jgi:hypothetical protein
MIISQIKKSHSQTKRTKLPPNKGNSFINYVKEKNRQFGNYSKPVSTYKCLGKQNLFGENDRRGCIFKNVCFKRSTKTFEFYNPTLRPVFYDKTFGPLFGFGKNFISMSPLWFFRDYFTPAVAFQEYPMIDSGKSDRIQLDKLHVFWSRKKFNLSV